MLRTLLFILLLCTCVRAQTANAQELTRSVVGSAGSYFAVPGVLDLHWTLGELAVDRTANGLVLARGFHQGNYELLTTAVWTAPDVDLAVTLFPNPTADRIILTGDWETGDRLRVQDLLGRRLSEQALSPVRAELALGRYPAGTYLLTIVRNGRPLQSLRVVRR